MGYYISTPHTSFEIRNENFSQFFLLVSDLMSDENITLHGNGGTFANGAKTESWYSWVRTDEVRKAVADRDIVRVFEEWGYELTLVNKTDEISTYYLDIRGGNAKIGDEEKFFAAIAPTVENGSYLDAVGEDGAEWRWVWENGKFYSQDVADKQIVYAPRVQIYSVGSK